MWIVHFYLNVVIILRCTWLWLCSNWTIFRPLGEYWTLALHPRDLYLWHLWNKNNIHLKHIPKPKWKLMNEIKETYLQYVTSPWTETFVKSSLLMFNCWAPRFPWMNWIMLPCVSKYGFWSSRSTNEKIEHFGNHYLENISRWNVNSVHRTRINLQVNKSVTNLFWAEI